MNQFTKHKIIKQSFKKFGETNQRNKLIEELSELSRACSRLNNEFNRENLNNFIEEIADVEILIDQFRRKYGTEIESVKVTKLERLEKRMNKEY